MNLIENSNTLTYFITETTKNDAELSTKLI